MMASDSEASSSDPDMDVTMADPAAPDADTELAPTADADTLLAWQHEVVNYPPTPPAFPAQPVHRPWLSATGVIAVLAALCVAFALCLVDLGLRRGWHDDSPQPAAPSAAPPQAPAVTTTPPPVAPPAASSVPPAVHETPPAPAPTPDEMYEGIVNASGLRITDPPPMIALGHHQCDLLDQGHTVAELVAKLLHQYTAINNVMAFGVVRGAVAAYCPEYTNQL